MKINILTILTILFLACSSEGGDKDPKTISKSYVFLDEETRQPVNEGLVTLSGVIDCSTGLGCGRSQYSYGITNQNGEVTLTISEENLSKVDVITFYRPSGYPSQEFTYSPDIFQILVVGF
ncbi:hypothetical protein [Aestuariivivens sediminis]|uniref:hypothetical protein n=1 Tax=Aestuariivivens sediminis TaxID=2913557 RepID=UPI001F599606|nr:hypothetical protein [Aestuariivivens sediminis]